MEPHSLLLNGLTAPLGPCCKKPGDCENDPPDHTSGEEKVEHHEEQCTDFALAPLHHCGYSAWDAGLVTCRLITQQESDKVNERHKAVADGIENDWPLWVAETLDIDEEGKESK